MSLVWRVLNYFIAFEIICLLLFMVPFIKPYMWQRLFQTNLFRFINEYVSYYFVYFMIALAVMVINAIRQILKHSHAVEEVGYPSAAPRAKDYLHTKLFEAQRNLYIAAGAFFFSLVLWRVCRLNSRAVALTLSIATSERQAQDAEDTSKRLRDELDALRKNQGDDSSSVSPHTNTTVELRRTIQELEDQKEKLQRTKNDLDTIKTKAEEVTKEYQQLLQQHSHLQAIGN